MEYLRKNLASLSLLAFAVGAFLAELAGSLPPDAGTSLAKVSLIALAAGRGLVLAAEALSPYHDSDGNGDPQVLMFPAASEVDEDEA